MAVKYNFAGDYQKRLLTLILSDPAFLQQSRDALDPTFFDNADHQTIASVVVNFFDRFKSRPGREVLLHEFGDYATRLEWDDKDRQRVSVEIERLYNIQLAEGDAESIKLRAKEFGQVQALKAAILHSVDLVRDYEQDPDSRDLSLVLTHLQKALLVGTASNTGINAPDHYTNLGEVTEEDTISDPSRRVPTGFTSVDRHLDGGLGAGELGFIVAESNKGKSMVLANFAHNAMVHGKKVIYFTLELKPYEVAARLGALASGLRIIEDVKNRSEEFTVWATAQQKVREYHKKNEERYKKQNIPSPGKPQVQVVYFKPSEATTLNLRSSIAKIQAVHGWKPDLIVVDYIDEMRATSTGRRSTPNDESSYHIYGQISADLIDLGADYLCPVWTASQIQREAYSRKDSSAPDGPTLAHLSRSIQKVEKAEVIISLYQTEGEEQRGQMRLRFLKNRRGGGKDTFVYCDVDFSRARIAQRIAASSSQ